MLISHHRPPTSKCSGDEGAPVQGRHYEETTGSHDTDEVFDKPARFGYVLDHVPCRHKVEGRLRQLGTFEAAGDHCDAALPCTSRRRRVELNAVRIPAALPRHRGEESVAAPHVQEPLPSDRVWQRVEPPRVEGPLACFERAKMLREVVVTQIALLHSLASLRIAIAEPAVRAQP